MQPGDRVNRLEDREVTGATVLSVQDGGDLVEIEYDEGGTGQWPADCLEPIE